MKLSIIAVIAASAVCVSAGPGAHAGRNVKAPSRSKPGLRKTRVTSRKLGDVEAEDVEVEDVEYEEAPPINGGGLFGGLGGIGNIIQPAFLLNLPVEVLEKLTQGAGGIPNLENFVKIADIGKMTNLGAMLDGNGIFGQTFGGDFVGQAVTKAKETADDGVARVEHFASAFADRGRGIVDMVGGKTQEIFDKGISVGSNTWQSAEDTARDLREESKAVADQAAAVAEEGVKVGERTFNSAIKNPIQIDSFFNVNDMVAKPFETILNFGH